MLRSPIRILSALMLWIFAASSVAYADDSLFVVKSKTGAADFVVTDSIVEKIGTKTYKAVLPSSDGAVQTVRGPLLRDVLKAAGASQTGVTAKAFDNYEMKIPGEDFTKFDVILAIEVDGKRLSVRNKGPAWVVYPSVDHPELQGELYQSRSVWQIKELIAE